MTANTTADWRRRTGQGLMALLGGLLVLDVARLLQSSWRAWGYPYDLDYGEGIVWQQLSNIAAGHGYAPLGTFPAIVYHYPPVYYLVTIAVAACGIDQLAAGRLVSFVTTLIAMILVGRLTLAALPARGRPQLRWASAAAAGVLFGTSPTVINWAALMRVDMLATALSLSGLWLTLHAVKRNRAAMGAAFCFVLAVYTKQTAIFAAAAAFPFLLLARPRAAWLLAAWGTGLAVAMLGALMALTDGQFLRHILLYNVNRLDLGRSGMLLKVILSQEIGCVIGLVTAAAIAWRLRSTGWATLRHQLSRSPVHAALVLALINLAVRTLTMPMILKSGASENYLIDWFAAVAVFAGVAIYRVARAVFAGGPWPARVMTALVLIGLPVQAWRIPVLHREAADMAWRARTDAIAARIRAADRPVITDYMVLLRRADQPVLLEPAIVAELSHAGLYDEAGFVRLIKARRFGFFVTQGSAGSKTFDEHYNPAVRAAIAQAYPVIERQDEYVLHLPPR